MNAFGLTPAWSHVIPWNGSVANRDFVNSAVETYSKSLDTNIEYRFLNYAHGNQNPLGSYGSENVARMKKVAAKYDPTGVFQQLMPGGFKISHVNDATPARDEL